MNVLGIETSCDETAASVVRNGKIILSNKVSSSLKFHKKYGGIVPEIAFRKQLETITFVADCAMKEARLSLKDINLISVTCGPGLLGSLLVGVEFAKALSLAKGIPLIGVNHVLSHIYANFLTRRTIKFPFVALVVSGGHTSLFYVKDFDKVLNLGSTQDDACGEAFDKAAKILGLGYPGGPQIEKAAASGDSQRIKFRCSGTKKQLNFSFSGIKTAVLYYMQNQRRAPGYKITRAQVADVAAGFQESALEVLAEKSLLACRMKKVKHLVVGGGVVANNRLREKFRAQAQDAGVISHFPSKELCMDNAAMVAGYGYQLFKKGIKSGLNLSVDLN